MSLETNRLLQGNLGRGRPQPKRKSSLTFALVLATIVACLGSIQFGYHIAELNAPQQNIMCPHVEPVHPPNATTASTLLFESILPHMHDLKHCIPVNDRQYGLITAMFSVGGLIGSLFTGKLSNRYGRKPVGIMACIVALCGSLALTYSNSYHQMLFARFIIGLAAGSSIVITPLYINEISPVEWRGTLGSMNQLSINLGILLTQSVAIKYATETRWRFILLLGAMLATLNLLGWFFVYESPKWMVIHSLDRAGAERALYHLRSDKYRAIKDEIQEWENDHRDSLLLAGPSSAMAITNSSGEQAPTVQQQHQRLSSLSMKTYITDPKYKQPRNVITALLMGQQFVGINSIIFYGVKVVSQLLPKQAILVNFGISIINVLVTLLSSLVVEDFGRKPLLIGSVFAMSISAFFISLAIKFLWAKFLVGSIFVYVASFAIGIGPIPFLIIGELSSPESTAVAQSYGTVCNWLATFLIGYLFPILNGYMGGYTFMLFSVFGLMFTSYIRNRVPETKGKVNYNDVWRGYT